MLNAVREQYRKKMLIFPRKRTGQNGDPEKTHTINQMKDEEREQGRTWSQNNTINQDGVGRTVAQQAISAERLECGRGWEPCNNDYRPCRDVFGCIKVTVTIDLHFISF